MFSPVISKILADIERILQLLDNYATNLTFETPSKEAIYKLATEGYLRRYFTTQTFLYTEIDFSDIDNLGVTILPLPENTFISIETYGFWIERQYAFKPQSRNSLVIKRIGKHILSSTLYKKLPYVAIPVIPIYEDEVIIRNNTIGVVYDKARQILETYYTAVKSILSELLQIIEQLEKTAPKRKEASISIEYTEKYTQVQGNAQVKYLATGSSYVILEYENVPKGIKYMPRHLLEVFRPYLTHIGSISILLKPHVFSLQTSVSESGQAFTVLELGVDAFYSHRLLYELLLS